MAYNLRYFINYEDGASGLPVVINISFPDFGGTPLELIPADTPCIVSEVNSEENIFSPIRAKEFRIKFVTDNNIYPGINDFATNSDNDWKIDILVGGVTWLTGFILTDQISEGWYTDGTNHYIELVATDNLGTLKQLPLKNMAGEDFTPTVKQFLIDIVRPALNQAIENLPINIFDNLFEVGFNDRTDTVVNTYTTTLTAIAPHSFIYLIVNTLLFPGDTIVITGSASNNGTFTIETVDRAQHFAHFTVLETVVNESGGGSGTPGVTMVVNHTTKEIDSYQQCMVDMRTFTVDYITYEDAYTVLTKLLESRNSVLFQHLGEWYIVRVSELFRYDTINGTRYNSDGFADAITDASWTADLNQAGDIIPVEEFMIKSFLNPVLSNKVIYKYTGFDEFLCNEIFRRGVIELDTPTTKEYHVDCWGHYTGAIISTTPASVLFRRREVYDAVTDTLTEDYIFLQHEPVAAQDHFVKSEPAQVSASDKLKIVFQRRLLNNYTATATEILARVLLYAYDGTYYTLDNDGLWYESNASFTVNTRALVYDYTSSEERYKWITKQVDSDFIPKNGTIVVLLYEGSANLFTGQETHFNDFKISYLSYMAGKNIVNVEADYHKLTLSSQLKATAEYEVFLSDSPKHIFKGALFMADGVTLTYHWYEMQFPSTQYPIKRFNAIDHYKMSNRNMIKADGSFYKWIVGEPINSVQKITITNGDPNKRFLPAFIRDLDTLKSKFSSLLIEVFDTSKEGAPYVFELSGFFIAPNRFQYSIGVLHTDNYFNPGDVITISGTASNNQTVTVVSAVATGTVMDVTFSGATIVNEAPPTDVTFTNLVNNQVNAAHEFSYIFKAK